MAEPERKDDGMDSEYGLPRTGSAGPHGFNGQYNDDDQYFNPRSRRHAILLGEKEVTR